MVQRDQVRQIGDVGGVLGVQLLRPVNQRQRDQGNEHGCSSSERKGEDAPEKPQESDMASKHAQYHHEQEGQGCRPRDKATPRHGVMHYPETYGVEIHHVGFRQFAVERQVAKMPRQTQGIGPVVLQAGQTQVLRRVILGVIPAKVVDEGDIEPSSSPVVSPLEIGVEGHELEDAVHERAGAEVHRGLAASGISHPLPGLVSNIREGPLVPRVSKLMSTPTLSAQGCA